MKQYKKLITAILRKGTVKKDRTGVGTVSIFGHQMRFNLQEGFPLVTTKKTHVKAIIHELLWFIKGDTNIQYLVKNGVHIWNEWPFQAYLKSLNIENKYPKYSPEWEAHLQEFVEKISTQDAFAQRWGYLGPVYGKQWRKWRTVDGAEMDQLEEIIQTLQKSPDSRRMIVTAWNPGEVSEMALPPCHTLFQFYTEEMDWPERLKIADQYTREQFFEIDPSVSKIHEALDGLGIPRRKLSCQLYQRSADVFLGVPFNIASYALLTMMIAQVTYMAPGEFIWTGGDCHLYQNHLKQAQEVLSRTEKHLPVMRLDTDVRDINDFEYGSFKLEGYEPHPPIKAPVAV